jgi:Ca2+-binding EF-hand superfamily protein
MRLRTALLALCAAGASAKHGGIGSHNKHDLGHVHGQLDENSDGVIDQAELESVLKQAYAKERSARTSTLLATKQDEIDTQFDTMDANSDGTVTKAEAMPEGSEADNIATHRRWKLAQGAGTTDDTLDKEKAGIFLFPQLSMDSEARSVFFAGESFDALDADGDGKIDLDEFQAHMQAEVKKHAADNLESIFMDDTDPKHQGILKEYLKVWFHKADADKNESISHSELPSAFQFFEEEPDFKGEAESAIRLTDTDKDQKLTIDEVKAAPTHVKDFLVAHGAVHGGEL